MSDIQILEPLSDAERPAIPRRKFIARCTPSLGRVSMWFHLMTENIMWPMNYGKIPLMIQDDIGNIAATRNKIVATALALEDASREITHLFWLDDDVIANPSCLLCLKNHHRPIVSGVYFTRLSGNLSEPLIFPSRIGGADRFMPNRAYEVWGHGMGLTLVEMSVYKRLLEAGLPKDEFGNPAWYRKTEGEYKIEDDILDCGGTEDLHFLDEAGKLGYKPFVDTGKHAFGFHFDLATMKGYPEKQWAQARKHKPLTWDTPDGEVVWN